MAIARFKKLCLDACDPELLGRFWAAALDQQWRPWDNGEGGVFGPTPQHTLWLNRVPQPKTGKNRVHLDVYVRELDSLLSAGATVVRPEGEDRRWTVLADPEGNEFCALLRPEPPAERVRGLVVDCAGPAALAGFWADVFDVDIAQSQRDWAVLERAPGMPTLGFVAVPEPKAGPNRMHWDVEVDDVRLLVAAGAVLLRAPDEEIDWHVLADPAGNEFCAFNAR